MNADIKSYEMESDDEEETEDMESKRRVIMRQILNDLLSINNEFETTKPCSFTPLEAITEEVTPSSSCQHLETNLSTAREDLEEQNKSNNDLELNISVSEDDDIQNKSSRKEKYETNILFVKHDSTHNKQKELSSRNTNFSPKAQNSLTKNFQSQEKYFKDKKRSREIKKFDEMINDDKRFLKKKSDRIKFKNLNKNYEKSKNNKLKQRWTIKTEDEPEKMIKYCGDVNFVCRNTYSRKTKPDIKFEVDYDKYSTEELEERLKYFESQLQKLKDEYQETEHDETEYTTPKYEGDNTCSSPDESHSLPTWRSQISQISNSCEHDKGDYSDNVVVETSENDSPKDQQTDEQKEVEIKEELLENEDSIEEIDLNPKKPTYSGTIIIVKNCSCETTDSGLYTSPSTNKSSQYIPENFHQPDEFPKIMLARSSKSVATQVLDEDWFRICEAKREMSAVRSRTQFSISSSDDENYLKNREQLHRKVLFKTQSLTVNNDFSDSSTDKELDPRFSVHTTNTDLTNNCCYCFPCSNLFRFLFTRERRQ